MAARSKSVLVLRTLAPVLPFLLFLWFPFDWLSEVFPPFGIPFRMVFRNARSHLIGHTVFFAIVGFTVLTMIPKLRKKPVWYLLGAILAALVQETIQAFFRGRLPDFSDSNAFTGDAIGTIVALVLACIIFGRGARAGIRE